MPRFSWIGIDLQGCTHRGNECAQSLPDLQTLLLQREIGLMHAQQARNIFFVPSIDSASRIEFFKQLALLLESGVHMSRALQILAQQTSNMRLQEIIFDLSFDVQQGGSLSQAMAKFPDVFGPNVVHVVRAGQEAGVVHQALHELARYAQMMEQMRKQLRSAAVVPIITLTVFVIIALGIFLFIIPSFAHVFKMSGQTVPPLTQSLFVISNALRSDMAFVIAGILLLAIFLVHWLAKRSWMQPIFDRIVIYIPFFGRLVKTGALVYFLQTLALLVTGGVHLVAALSIASESVSNTFLRAQFSHLEQLVDGGASLAQAMNQSKRELFAGDLIAMVTVGQEAACLGFMLSKATDLYYHRLLRMITIFTRVFQPLLMIVLGLLIAALIFIVYIPIFSISDTIVF